MRPYGSDRIRRAAGERVVLASRLSKGWVPRAAKTLTLVVDFGKAGDVQAHVNWADARLLPDRGAP